MLRPTLLLLALTLFAVGRAAKCPRQKTSPGREILCYTSTLDAQSLSDSICRCTTIVHEGHDLANLSTSAIEDLRKTLKETHPSLQFIVSVKDVSNTLRTSATVRQEAIARLAGFLNEVDGVELNVTAGSKERLVHFVKGLKDEIVRKAKDKRILMNLPTKPEILAKQFDVKDLTKYVDLFTISTHYLVSEDEGFKTFHPSRMMGLFDMFNTDSLVDLVNGLGAPKRKILISLPATSYKFALKSEEENTPISPTTEKEPVAINRKQLCEAINDGQWTIERDEDLTAPYAFKNKTWIAFEDKISIGIKGKYVLLRDLAGIGIHDVENDLKTDCGNPLTHEVYHSFMDLKRKSRQAVLSSLEDDLHQAQLSYPKHARSSDFRIVRIVDTQGHIQAIRENTQTEFSCTRQGYFVHPRSCNRFYRCVKFNQEVEDYSVFEFDCPAGLAFDERTEVCVWPHTLPQGSPCPGSSEIAPTMRARFRCPSQPGYYADKQNCRWFFACMDLGDSELSAFEFRCPFGLVFDEEKLVCEWPWLVPSCSDSGNGYTRTEYDNSGYGSRSYGQDGQQEQQAGGFGFSGPAGVDLSGSVGGSIGDSSIYSGSTSGHHYGFGGNGQEGSVDGQYYGSTVQDKSAGHSATADGHNGVYPGATGVVYHGSIGNGHTLSTDAHSGLIGGYGGSTNTGSIGSFNNLFNKEYSDAASSGQSTLTSGSSASTALHSGTAGESYSGSTNSFGSSSASQALIDGLSGSVGSEYYTPARGYSESAGGYSGRVGSESFGSAEHVNSIGSTGIYSGTHGRVHTESINKYGGSTGTGHVSSINGGYSTDTGHSTLSGGFIEIRTEAADTDISGARIGQNRGSADGSYSNVYGASHTPVNGAGNSDTIISEYPGSSTYTKSSVGVFSGQSVTDTSFEHSSIPTKTAFNERPSDGGYAIPVGIGAPGVSIYPTNDVTGSSFHNIGSFSTSQTDDKFTNGKTIVSTDSLSGSQAANHGTYYGSTTGVLNPGVTTNYHGHAGVTSYITNSFPSGQGGYTSEQNIYNTNDGTTGIYSTSGVTRNSLNISLTGADNLSSDNIHIYGGIGSSAVYTHGTSRNYGLGTTRDHSADTYGVTGHIITGNTIQGPTAGDDSVGGTLDSDGGISRTAYTGTLGHGTLVTGVSQPGYVNVNTGTPAYVITDGPSTPAPGVFVKGQSNRGIYLNGQTTPGILQGGFDQLGATVGSSGIKYSSSTGATQHYGSGGSLNIATVAHSGTAEISTKSPSPLGTDYQTQEYQFDKDIPDYRPSSPIGGIENTDGAYYRNTLIQGQGQNFKATSSVNAATYTQNGFTKTGPTKTGITVASLGGKGTYVISNGQTKPTLNYNKIGETAFEGNVAGYTESSTQCNSDINDFSQVKSTVTPSIIGSSYTSDISDIDSSRITLGPAASSGYTYSKPSIPFESKTTAVPTRSPNVVVASTTPESFLNVEVHNRPTIVSSTPITAFPAVVNTYDTGKSTESNYHESLFESSKIKTQSVDSSPIYQRPTILIDRQPSTTISPTIAYTTGPLENYRTTVFNAAKLPVGISTVQPVFDNGYKTVISSTTIPVTFDSSKVSYNENTFQTGSIPSRPSPKYTFTKSGIPSISTVKPLISVTPEVSYERSTAAPFSPQYSYSTAKSVFGENVSPSTTTYQQTTEPTQPKVLYLSSTTDVPAMKQDVFKGYSYPKPTISTDTSLYRNRGYTMTTLGSSITTGESAIEQVEKVVSHYGRGSVKYTTGSYESPIGTKGTSSSGSIAGNEYTRKESSSINSNLGTTYVSTTAASIGRTPSPPVITTYSGGYSKIPTSTPLYTVTKPAVETSKGKIIVKWSDLHPLLLGKLGAECTCKADPFANLRGPGSRQLIASSKGQVDLSNYDESDVYVDLGSGEAGNSDKYSSLRITTYRTSLPSVKINGKSENSEKDRNYEKPSSTYLPRLPTAAPSPLYLPSLTTRLLSPGMESSLTFNKKANTPESSVIGRVGKNLKNNESTKNSINGAGASFDRYGPGGLRDAEETLEGVTECARPGLFRHPNYCNKFYACHWDEWKKKFTLHVFNCPVHLTFDISAGACNWPSKGPACQDGNLLV